MARIYKYAILIAIPDAHRGERVNVGIAVFTGADMDIRFSGVSKLAALSGGEWSVFVSDASARMKEVFQPYEEPEQFLRRYALLEQWIQFSNISWFDAITPEEYELRVDQIVSSLVRRPREPSLKTRATKINTEIASVFRNAHVLASREETVEDHKVVRDYYISREEELRADFVHKNGLFHVTATLDLRRPSVELGRAALKAIVLDKAGNALAGGARRYAVYAVAPGAQQFRPHVELLRDYSDNAFNWLVPEERDQYTRTIYASLAPPFGLV